MTQSNVLITGASGALGAALADSFLQAGEALVLASRTPEAPRLGELARRGALVVAADSRNPRTLAALPPARTLIHLVDTRDESLSRADFWDVNVASVYNILEWALENGVRRVVLRGAAEVAGMVDSPGAQLTEDDTCAPDSVYGKAKLAAERVGLQWSARHRVPLTVARLAPVFGRGAAHSSIDAAIRWVATGALSNAPRERYLHPLHLDDAVQALRLLADGSSSGPRTFFVSTASPESEREIWRKLARAAGREALAGTLAPVAIPIDEPVHQGYCSARLAAETGFRPGRWLENQLLSAYLDARGREIEAVAGGAPGDPGSSGIRDLFGRVRTRLLRAA